MSLTNQTNKKSLNDYSQLVTKIRNEYNILVKENEALKSQLEQYKNYYDANIVRQKNPGASYRKRKPNYRYSYHNYEDDDEDDELKNNYYIPKRKKKGLKKREIIYKDLVDGYEPSSPTEDEEEIDDETGEEDDDEIYETGKTKKQQPKNSKTKIIEVIQKPKTKKNNKKGITKTIKM